MPSTKTDEAVALEVTALPAHCPHPAMPLWSSHPRVSLEFDHGLAKCPYCGTTFRLAQGVAAGRH
ncbi:MAG: zinc-finger domain-containing protein [Burkholderiaceae bacterium]|nr:zinc-finger domain-containing protein [Burkholderiaceae bacterium]